MDLRMTDPPDSPSDGQAEIHCESCPACPLSERKVLVWTVVLLLLAGLAGMVVMRNLRERIEGGIDPTPLPLPDVDAPFVTTPQDIVDAMLALAGLTSDDVLYDLGCGDGRIVVSAAKQFGCRAVGYDNNPERIKECLENAAKYQVEDLVAFHQEDIFTLDLSGASVVTLYLLPRLNVKLIPQLEKLKPGSRIISHDFDMQGVTPDKVIRVYSEEQQRDHTLYLWTTPLHLEPAAE